MSWLARSLANTLIPDQRDDGDDDEDRSATKSSSSSRSPEAQNSAGGAGGDTHPIDPGTPTRGVKDDLSELTETLTRQFWGVASFLAPPPSQISSSSSSSAAATQTPSDLGRRGPVSAVSGDPDKEEVYDPQGIAGIRSDLAEIGGRFRTGISKLSSNKAVSEISKIASTFLPFGSEEKEYEDDWEREEWPAAGDGAVGVTDEVLAFARNISMHPETWLDFPLLDDDDDSDDFDISDAQQEHALAVEHLVPRLAALRIELCPSHMSEGCFWKIYFVLLHSRLNKHDAEYLSTPQIVEARARWLQELQHPIKDEPQRFRVSLHSGQEAVSLFPTEEYVSPASRSLYGATQTMTPKYDEAASVEIDIETEKHPVQTNDINIIDKSVIQEDTKAPPTNKDDTHDNSNLPIETFDEDGDDWLEEDTGDASISGIATIRIDCEEHVSFSDLEEDDTQNVPTSSKTGSSATGSQK